jgi:2-C-methyl-D-erythritol 4-phosphate cytidylyltransferase
MELPLHLIIVAGGSSRRFGGGDKLLTDLNGAPVFVHALRRLTPVVTGKCVLVVPAGKLRSFQDAAFPFVRDLDLIWCEGGSSRSGSVKNGVAALGDVSGIAAVHDAARPLANAGLLRRLYDAALVTGAALPGKPVADTLWKSDGESLESTVSRDGLFAVETPQLFELELWKKACEMFPDADLTDDAGLLRKANFPVALVHNIEPNIKLTTQADLMILRALI